MSNSPSRAACTKPAITGSSAKPCAAAKANGLMRFRARSGAEFDRRLQGLGDVGIRRLLQQFPERGCFGHGASSISSGRPADCAASPTPARSGAGNFRAADPSGIGGEYGAGRPVRPEAGGARGSSRANSRIDQVDRALRQVARAARPVCQAGVRRARAGAWRGGRSPATRRRAPRSPSAPPSSDRRTARGPGPDGSR